MAFNRVIEVLSGTDGKMNKSFPGCYISFEIERNKTTTPNKATVNLYNLSENSMALMGKKENKIIIQAGYADEGGSCSLFYGDITKSIVQTEKPNTVLKIEAMDGYKTIQSKNVALSYGKSSQVSTILDDILNIMALPLGNKKPVITDVYSGGYAFIGKAQDALTQVLSRVRYKWTIQNEQIYIYQEGAKATTTALKLTPGTGLLSIGKIEQDLSVKNKAGHYSVGYKMETLLFPQIIPGAIIVVESPAVSGNMMVDSSKATADNFGGDFKIEAEVHAV